MKVPARKIYFTLVSTSLIAIAANFNSCAPLPTSKSIKVSPRSPFYKQRVRIFEKSQTEVPTQSEALQRLINIIVDNSCAIESCSQVSASEAQGTLVCPQVLEFKRKDLEHGPQAYQMALDASATAKSIEAQLQRSPVDNKCVIGVSDAITYTLGQAAATQVGADPDVGRQYFHEVINGSQSYPFFANADLAPINVAVIDTGIEITLKNGASVHRKGHPDLEMPFYAPNEQGGSGPSASFWTHNYSVSCATICNQHGTMVGGIIGANANNATGGRGVAPNVILQDRQVGDNNGIISNTELFNALSAYNYVKLDILNLSLGGSDSHDFALQDALIKLIANDTLIVVSAGNDSKNIALSPYYPAAFNFDSQITVGAASPEVVTSGSIGPYNLIGSRLRRDAYSNYGKGMVHLAAPGTAIYSTGLNGSYRSADGTSFAAPIVAGAAALAKGYLKARGLSPSSAVVKQLVLQGTRSLPELRETINGVETSVFDNDRFLDLAVLAEVLQKYAADFALNQYRLDLLNSSVQVVGGAKTLVVEIGAHAVDLTGLRIKIYTNKGFLLDSFTGAQCDLGTVNQCKLEINFQKLLIDDSLYITLEDATGKILADLSVPLQNLNLGNRAESNIEGAVVAAYPSPDGYTLYEGWACLVGFPDQLDIIGTLDGSDFGFGGRLTTYTSKTDLAARGDYFAKCKSPTITHGFRLKVSDVFAGRLTLKAVHPDGSLGKSLALPNFVYQPGYQDPMAAETSNSVVYYPRSSPSTTKITKKKFKNWVLEIEGTNCARNGNNLYSSPNFSNALSLNFKSDQGASVIPEIWDSGGRSQSGVQTIASTVVNFRDLKMVNPTARINDTAGLIFRGVPFSEIYDEGGFQSATLPSAKMLILNQATISRPGNFDSYNPDLNTGDGCSRPSGFKISKDIRPYLKFFEIYAGLLYRNDVYPSTAAALAVLGMENLAPLLDGSIQRNFDQLRFLSRAFSISLNETANERGSYRALFEPANGFQYQLQYSSVLGEWISAVTASKTDFGLGSAAIISDANVALTGAGTTSLAVVYTGPILTLPLAEQNRIYAGFSFAQGTRFGELGKDIVVEAKLNGSATWLSLPIDLASQSKLAAGYQGFIVADADLPVDANTVQLRIRSNSKNILTIKRVGLGTP